MKKERVFDLAKRRILNLGPAVWTAFFLAAVVATTPAAAQVYDPVHVPIEKVKKNIYYARQLLPLGDFTSIIPGIEPGDYETVNLFVIKVEEELYLIDAGLAATYDNYRADLENQFPNAHVEAVLLTHSHLDHAEAAHLFHADGIPVYASQAAIDASGTFGFSIPLCEPFCFPIPFEPGDVWDLGKNWKLTAFDTKGHTPGHVVFLYEKAKDCDDGENDDCDDDEGEDCAQGVPFVFMGDVTFVGPENEPFDDPYSVTSVIYEFVVSVLTWDGQLWVDNLRELKTLVGRKTKLLDCHSRIPHSFWKDAAGSIDYTIEQVQFYTGAQ
jgi:glyoxylase-like metal-dependent hydrolase (beta-lactamase superfamily II)